MVPNKTGQGMGHIYHTTWAGVFKGGLAKNILLLAITKMHLREYSQIG